MGLLQRHLVQFIGGLWGDQRDGLACANDHFFAWEEEKVDRCPVCGSDEVFAKLPHAEVLALRWQIWRSKVFPHRLYTFDQDSGDVRFWEWRGRRFLERPYRGWESKV